jgi:hypothetical protein
MTPFKLKLASRNGELATCPGATDLRSCKAVTAVERFAVNDPQILGNEADWERSFLKPKQLRVTGVSNGVPSEYSLRKKSFPPQSDQPAGV